MATNSQQTSPQARDFLRDAFLERKRRNPAYSTRALARDLGVSQSFVSLVLSGKKKLPLKRAVEFSRILGMDGVRSEAFVRAAASDMVRDKSASAYLDSLMAGRKLELRLLALDQFKAIATWYHFAILDFTTCKGFRSDSAWVAERLGLSQMEVHDAVERLVRIGLLDTSGKRWRKTNLHLAVPSRQSEQAIRSFHRQMIGKAIDALAQTDGQAFAARLIAGSTVAVNPKKLTHAKEMISRFQKKLLVYLTEGECSELYQFNFQLFPLTQSKRKFK